MLKAYELIKPPSLSPPSANNGDNNTHRDLNDGVVVRMTTRDYMSSTLNPEGATCAHCDHYSIMTSSSLQDHQSSRKIIITAHLK